MRVIAAGCFVFAGLLCFVVLGGVTGLDDASPWVIGLVSVPVLFGLIGLALWLFNHKGANLFGMKSAEEHLRELESRGLLDSTDFHVTRAFGVEEFEDEGIHYYLELADRRVLFLSGQYLYDFEPIDDPHVNLSRRFPCSEFTVRRHKEQGYVADIQCRGAVLEPEFLAPPFDSRYWEDDRLPHDGQIISDRTYEELKREHRDETPEAAASGSVNQ